ncbi:hypothetical protein BDZ97DRAFT_1929977 [Flammula alnicola]|nr:hypothetical protein BDZ97DRAFT_1929977 [Flammula alnicola]
MAEQYETAGVRIRAQARLAEFPRFANDVSSLISYLVINIKDFYHLASPFNVKLSPSTLDTNGRTVIRTCTSQVAGEEDHIMEIRKQKHIPLACRYIPYDQWFLTHVDPTWKIKHFKQSILAKCFGLPFDPRRITKDVPGVRPPSPITFAPDEGQRPISPIKFANPQELRKKRSAGGHPEEDGSSNNQQEDAEEGGGGEEGYEEDDEWEDDDDFDDLEPPPMFASTKPVGLGLTTSGRVDVPMPVAPPLGVGPVPVAGGKKKRRFNPLAKISTAGKSASNATSTPSNHPDALQDQIQCQWFTLIRFSTGQILEDDYLVSWYDLAAYELVELHSSSPPVSFAISASLGQLLLHGTINADANILNQGNNPSQVKSGIINTSASRKPRAADVQHDFYPALPHPLPRYDPAAYVQPYWEGWVRALRVVWRSSASGVGTDPTPGGRGKYEFPEYPAGMATMGGGGSGMAMWESAMYMDGDGKGVDGRYPRLHLQGRRVGWARDPIPTHRLPLSALITSEVPNILLNPSIRNRHTRARHQAERGAKGLHGLASTTETDNLAGAQTLARPKTVVDIEEVPPHNAHAAGEKDMTAAHRRRPAANASALTQVESGERQRIRERELQREKEREKERERRRIREKQEKEVEYLRRWDDIGLSFPFGGKGKEKEKAGDKRRGGDSWDKHREKEKERSKKDKESSKDKEQAERAERERAREREKEKERERQKERREREKEKEKARLNDRTYIPYSREEAEAAGMKIICAKFQSTRIWEREKKERERQKPAVEPANQTPKYTSTGPSLAGGGGWKDVHGQPLCRSRSLWRRTWSANTTMATATRRVSLPAKRVFRIGTWLRQTGTTPSVSMSSLATSGTASSQGRPEHPAVAGSSGGAGGGKFAIVGLFAKERKLQMMPLREKTRRQEARGEGKEGEGQRAKAARKEKKGKEGWTGGRRVTVTRMSSQHHHHAVAGAADGERSDSDSSSLSLSSPVFAHSTESDQSFDEDDLSLGIYGKDRKGYRYGGYHPPAGKLQSRTTQGPSNVELDGNKSESSRSYLMMINKTGLEDPESSRTETERVRTLDKGKGRASEREHLPPLHLNAHPKSYMRRRRGKRMIVANGWFLIWVLSMYSAYLPQRILCTAHVDIHTIIDNGCTVLAIRRTFWSSSAHGHGADDESLNDERSLIGGASSSSHANAIAPTAGSDADDDIDDIYADSAMVPASHQNRSHQAQKSKTIHPQVLASLTLNPAHPNTSLAPALPYPEWRIELVLRARLYGMHEAGRPLELAMYGWGRDFVEMEKASVSYRKRRRKEEAGRRRVRTSLFGGPTLDESVSLSMGKSRWIDDDAQQSTEGSGEADRDEIAAEDRGRERNWDGVESARRMSQVSHVSTIKATVMNIAGATHRTPIQPTDEEDDAESTAHELGETQTERSLEDSGEGGVDGFQDDKYEAGYAYGQDDEEDALFEGLGSVMEDSEEESETEWLAWPTDLSRQVIVRQQKMELDRIQQQRAREDELRDRLDHDQPPLSPMVFLNPFPGTDTASFISQNVGLPSVLPPVPPPKTPEEERRQYAEKKRKLEPSAVSTSLLHHCLRRLSLPVLRRQIPHLHTIILLLLRVCKPTCMLMRVHQAVLYLMDNTDITGSTSQAAPPRWVTNSYSNPISPLAGFSPIDDEDLEAELDAPTSSTMPPSATGHSYTRQVHQRSHSRSISGSSPGSILAPFKTAHMQSISKSQAQVIEDEQSDLSSSWPTRGSTLHHSMSMPLAGCGYPDATPLPQSPSRMSTAKILPQPISMPILTQAQISQIESETEEMMLRAMSNPPSPSTSPSSFGHSSMRDPAPASFMTIPRRSGSTGVVPGSPPSAGSGGSVGRSASVLVKPSPSSSETGGNERGMLRKKRSDTVTTAGGGDKMETEQSPQPNTRPRPSLSLQSLSGSRGRTVEVQSPTQQRHALRSPTTAHPHSHTGNHGSTAVSVSGGASTMASAKAILRRVRSGSSLGMDMRIEEVSPHAEESQASWRPNSPAASTSAAGNGSLEGVAVG